MSEIAHTAPYQMALPEIGNCPVTQHTLPEIAHIAQ